MRRICQLGLYLVLLVCCFAADQSLSYAQHCASPTTKDACSFGLNESLGFTCGPNPQHRYQSLFWAGIDGMWLTHSGSAFRSEVLDPNNNSVVVSQTLEHGLPIAPRFRLGSLLTENVRGELSYFGTSGWESSARIQNVAPLPDLNANVNYDAQLNNFECNFMTTGSIYDPYWLLGVRYLRYEDSFVESYRLDPGFGTVIEETANGDAANDLFGPQVGLGMQMFGGSFQFGGKIGFMNNQISQSGPSYTNAILIDGNPETTFDNESDTFVLLGDLEVTLTRQISSNLSIRLGYQGLFLDNIAQSATQNGGQAQPDEIAFHGFLFGAEFIQ